MEYQESSYFHIAVSNRTNLDLCREHGVAGFPATENGDWAFADISVGDYVSFIFGARIFDLYRVTGKTAIENPEEVPPSWNPLEFDSQPIRFPFRLQLNRLRDFEEPFVRQPFRYVENELFRRGGYQKTHFQADRQTLQNVSKLGEDVPREGMSLSNEAEDVTPKWKRSQGGFDRPEVCRFREEILQAALRQYFTEPANLEPVASHFDIPSEELRNAEILSEHALPEGYADILVKTGEGTHLPIEVKLNRAGQETVEQVRGYEQQLRNCPGSVIIAGTIGRDIADGENLLLYRWSSSLDLSRPQPFDDIPSSLSFTRVERS